MGFLAIAFAAGVLTVLAPCILPLLPIVIGGSVAGETSVRRAAVISTALGASVFLFTILLKVSTAFVSVPPLSWQLLSGGLILLFGLVTFFPSLWDKIPFVQNAYRSSNRLLGAGYQKSGVWGEALMGAALGPVFSSCSPTYFVILATVLPVNFYDGVAYLLAYVVGLSLFLFAISFFGQKAVATLGVASDPNGWFKRGIGLLFIVVGVGVVFGYDKKLEAALPASAFGEIGIEQRLISLTQPAASSSPFSVPGSTSSAATTTAAGSASMLDIAKKSLLYPKASELVSPDAFLNTNGQPISLAQYRGKDVVLLDFWDYSCINCQRTIPYLEAWYQKYKDQGLVVIGVHTPEFSFEHQTQNVADALKQFGITYPVILDNEYKTWNAYNNEYWPNEYLIDIDGFVVDNHSGEGDYDKTEQAIQKALAERAARLGTAAAATGTVNIAPQDLSVIQSPETYFGSARNEYLGNGVQGQNGVQTLMLPDAAQPNTLFLGGTWNFSSEYATPSTGAQVLYEYSAHDVYMVATASTPVHVKVLLDGKPVGNLAGADVDPTTSTATIEGDRLYKLVHNQTPGAHVLELIVQDAGLQAYTFTFG